MSEGVASQPRPLSATVAAFSVTQMTGWGTTYYLPGVLSRRFETELGLNDIQVFSGITIMLITSAMASYAIGRQIDRHGARPAMMVGSVLLAFGLAMLSRAQDYTGYAMAWFLFGLAMPSALSSAAFTALTQVAGQQARRAISALLLFGGLALTLFWPLTAWLDAHVGWRQACLIFAAMHLLICLPLHAFFAPGSAQISPESREAKPEGTGLVLPHDRFKAFLLLVLAIALNGFISWGFELHMIGVFTDMGLSLSAAVAVASLKGPVALASRGFELFSNGRVTPLIAAQITVVLLPIAFVLALIMPAGTVAALIFVLVFSIGTGLMTVVRVTLPLALFGAAGFGATLGKVALPTQIVFALSPMIFASAIAHLGPQGGFWLGLAAALGACAAIVMLSGLIQKAREA